ncbi:MAG: energy-coupling factor transporter ATPase [Lachnospiraceae bacterium]|nr:energy-coupling factor transporter ATPase [Lachnospiraceae bacterium]
MQIEFENVNYIYNPGTAEEVTALKNITVTVGGDQFIAVIGNTGSGKSTFIQMMNGLIKPSGGKILYDGREIFGQKNEKKLLRDLRCRVGLTFQYPEHQLFETDVYTDVAFGPKNQGVSSEEIPERVKRALEAVGMDESYHQKSPFELSGGEMRRAAIAGMLAMEPDMLILDEPTAGLDPLGKVEILNKLKSIQQENHITVILVSHTMEEVARYADRVIAMDGGEILFDLPVYEAFSDLDRLEDMGLMAPEVRYFMEDLKDAGLDINENCITVGEACREIERILSV